MRVSMRLRLLALALAALLELSLGLHSERGSLITLLPASLDGELALETGARDEWTISASRGNVLAVHTVTARLQIPPSHDGPAISSMQIVWTPSSTPPSTAFDRVFGPLASSSLPGLYASGLHVRVATTPDEKPSQLHAVQARVMAMLYTLLPSLNESLPASCGESSFMARALCPETRYEQHTTSDGGECFGFTVPQVTYPLPRSQGPLETWFSTLHKSTALSPRVLAVSMTRDASEPKMTVNGLQIGITHGSSAPSTEINPSGSTPRAGFVSKVDGDSIDVSFVDTSESVARSIQLPQQAVSAKSVEAELDGEGFHRTLRLQVSVPRAGIPVDCGADAKFLAVVAIPSTMYADLDELRRMERFGHLRLYSPTKYIEIERPSAVSSQHTIGLEFARHELEDTTVLDVPVHLRYQSPSNERYAHAVMPLPELFVVCGRDGTSLPPSSTQNKPSALSSLENWLLSERHSRVLPVTTIVPGSISTQSVPIGVTPHAHLVGAITLSVTALGALLLVYVSLTSVRNSDGSGATSSWKPKKV